MDHKLALTTAVTLAHREFQTGEEGMGSIELIRELLDLIKVSDVNLGQGSDNNAISNIKSTLADMCRQSEIATYEPSDLLVRLRVNVGDDEKWYNAMERSINSKLDELAILKSITVLRAKVRAFIDQEKIAKILREGSSAWNFRYSGIDDPKKYIQDVIAQLETVAAATGERDTAVMDEVDFDRPETLEAVTKQVVSINDGTNIWKTGHQAVNEMWQGGLRAGETIACGALAHNDKTGTTLTLFRQLAKYNKPIYRKPGKKPCLVRLTFEDPMSSNILYLYKDIEYNRTGEFVDVDKVDPAHMRDVVREEMTQNGFAVRMAYVDPTEWSYRQLQNYVLKLEAEGLDVQVLMVDYLSMLPTTGCRQGPTGADLQDLFRRMRNFCRSRGILFITPHQLSTQAKELTRGVVSDETLLPFISMKGYWAEAKGLDREFDGAFYVHIIRKDGVAWKAFQRDKHRWPGILEENKKFFIYQFPHLMPIPDDVGKERLDMKKIGRPVSNAPSTMFDF